MEKLKINKELVTQVKICDFQKAESYKYIFEKRLFGIIIKKEGVYWDGIRKYYYGNNVPQNYIIREHIVYQKPKVILTLASGQSKSKYFDTLENANLWVNNEFNGWRFINY